jgi:hypothetical protein
MSRRSLLPILAEGSLRDIATPAEGRPNPVLGARREVLTIPASLPKQHKRDTIPSRVRILDHSEAVVAVNHFSVGAARAAQRKVLEGIVN